MSERVNTWPGGKRRAMTQDEHARWNAQHWPGTRQMCAACGEPTSFCEDEGYYRDDGEPLCEACWKKSEGGDHD